MTKTKENCVIAFFLQFFLIIFLIVFLASSLYIPLRADAQAQFDCTTLNTSSTPDQKVYCQQELTQIEAQLAQLVAQQKQQQQTTGTLKGDVDYLTSQINALTVKVKARSLAIASLTVDISNKATTIQTLSDKIDSENQSLAQLLRNTNEFDKENIVNLVLSDDTISDFYSDLESYSSIKEAVKASVDQINGVKAETEIQKQNLITQQNAETDAKAQLMDAQQQVAQSKAAQAQLLAISQNKEAGYALLAAQKKAQADKIRAALFPLAGISQKIEFGTALQYADKVQQKTGVDPAFLLAILTQESNLGGNVGQCYLTDESTGAGVGINTGIVFANVMKPTRDVQSFISITNTLGINAFQTPVSCPIAGVGGYGGAMGPAQFIPSTWQLFASRLQTALGHFANPWSPEDSFMASGLYLSDLGAVGDSASAQNVAACKYYGSGGRSCSYSRSVQSIKRGIQKNINTLNLP